MFVAKGIHLRMCVANGIPSRMRVAYGIPSMMSVANGIPSIMSVANNRTNKPHCLLLQHVGVHLDIGGDHGHHGKTTSYSKREGLPNRHQRAKDIDVRQTQLRERGHSSKETHPAHQF